MENNGVTGVNVMTNDNIKSISYALSENTNEIAKFLLTTPLDL